MKTTKLFSTLIFVVVAATHALISCGKDDGGEPTPFPSQYTIAVTSGGNGTAQAAAGGAVVKKAEAGTTITLTATPSEGYEFSQWVVADGAIILSSATASPTTFTMPSKNVSVKAEFVAESTLPALPVPDGSALAGIIGAGEKPHLTATYVGAFWNANQIGERVIDIDIYMSSSNATNMGEWSAEVAWYDSKWDPANGDGVVLAVGGSADANIYGANPGDAESYPVLGTAAKVSGMTVPGEDILFRIGLTKTFAAYNAESNPARYAVVVLTYGTPAKKQKIFLRQGEGADYVMRPGDKDGDGNIVGGADNRSFARKFSPYNLVDPNGNTESDFNNMTTAATGLLPVNGGAFADYPTQAGYFFQWNYSRRAFHPTSPMVITNWYSSSGNAFWRAGTDETCPAGWRRPQDGNTSLAHNTTGPIEGSEMRQSLWLNPKAGLADFIDNSFRDNSIWGYYADGWFDRREIEASFGPSVSSNTKDVANVGRLFFNPNTTSNSYHASLFFPAAGTRTSYSGGLYDGGFSGYYWSGSSSWTDSAWHLYLDADLAKPGCYRSRSYAMSVRCVRVE